MGGRVIIISLLILTLVIFIFTLMTGVVNSLVNFNLFDIYIGLEIIISFKLC
jgi:hypothetical protein